MPKWEYAIIEHQGIPQGDKWEWKLRFIGTDGRGETLENTDILVLLNQYGRLGWELVEISIKSAGLFLGTSRVTEYPELKRNSIFGDYNPLPLPPTERVINYQVADPMVRQFWLKR